MATMSAEENSRAGQTLDKDTMKILLATDIHLGYESGTKRLQDNDSFITFEEILQHAHTYDVDFILLGGDLFHDSKPSQKIVLQCMELLNKYTLGEREVQIRFMSNPEIIFPHSKEKMVNFENPNINISMPVFSIHGNHDNPSFETVGSMDVLGASGLINYFGKWPDVTSVTIPPLLLNKGKTYVSIYGLSYMNDQRLSRLLKDKQLILLRPVGVPEPFKLLVLHQNRAEHTPNGFIPQKELPECLDLVFWGHEHECRVIPEAISDTDNSSRYHITQPGSSVATSLCPGEAVQKKIALLKINSRRQFKILPIKLKTVRPFVFEDVHLQSVEFEEDLTKPPADIVFDYIDDYIQHIVLPKAKKQITDNPCQPTIPLIRLRIFYTDKTQVFDVLKLYRKYTERVANPRDMVIFRKEKSLGDDEKKGFDQEDEDYGDISECFRTNDDEDWNRTVQGGIRNWFAREDRKDDLKVLSVTGLNEAVKHFVEASDDNAFKDIVEHQSKKVMEYLKKYDIDDENDIKEQLKVYREERRKAEGNGEEEKELNKVLTSDSGKIRKKTTPPSKASAAREESDVEIDNLDDQEEQPATRGRGRGSRARGRGSRGGATTTRGSTRGRGKAAAAETSLNASITSFLPTANSTLKPTQSTTSGAFSLSQFRRKPSQTSQKRIYIDDSDSE